MQTAAVCFDLDGVLVDTMPLHAQAWQQTLAIRGIRILRRDIYLWEGEPGKNTARTLLSRNSSTPSAYAIAQLLKEKEGCFLRLARKIPVHPQFMKLIDRLSLYGLKLALVTGTSFKEVKRMVPKKVLDKFNVIITGDQVRHGKPHPEPYKSALRKLGVSASKAIVIENAPYGIRSAKRAKAGMVIALATSLPKRYLCDADVVVGSVAQVVKKLRKLTTGC